jgi:hypothetical protein
MYHTCFHLVHCRYQWCQGKDCKFVLMLPQGLGPVALQCKCGAKKFCSGCRKESHSPCNCSNVADWIDKEVTDNMSMSWIKDHTNTCPKCFEAIEKNGGCDQMICRCAHRFCWKCLRFPQSVVARVRSKVGSSSMFEKLDALACPFVKTHPSPSTEAIIQYPLYPWLDPAASQRSGYKGSSNRTAGVVLGTLVVIVSKC